MTPYQFRTATAIRFGRGTAAGAPAEVAALGRRVLVCHGRTGARAVALIDGLRATGCDVMAFAVPGEPEVARTEAGVAAARAAGAEVVVSVGGGAVIDAGKAIAALAPARRPIMDHLEVVGRGLPLQAAPLPFVALPTTAGTGAEVTKNAVIGVPEARRKVSLRDERMLARLAIVDPGLTDNAPVAVTLAAGLDAVVQLIEPYLSSKANPLTDAICRATIPVALDALRRVVEGDETARDEMAHASLCGGLALANAGLGAVHGLAGPIGGVAPAPHGAVCGVLLPHVLAANRARATGDVAARMDEVETMIAARFGSSAGLGRWAAGHGLPGLAELGLRAADHAAVAEAAVESSSMKGNPVALAPGDLVPILEAASGPGRALAGHRAQD